MELAMKALKTGALETGKHVMLEKPMAINVQECDTIINAADRVGVKLMICHSLRFFPPFQLCKKLVGEGEGGIGRMIRIRATHMGYRYMACGATRRALVEVS